MGNRREPSLWGRGESSPSTERVSPQLPVRALRNPLRRRQDLTLPLPIQLCPIVDVVLGLVNDQLGLVDCKFFLLCFIRPTVTSANHRRPGDSNAWEKDPGGWGRRPAECSVTAALRESLPGLSFCPQTLLHKVPGGGGPTPT